MAKRPLPSPEVLRQLLRYEPDTGKLFWLPRGPEWFKEGPRSTDRVAAFWNRMHAGKEAFTSLDSHGYMKGAIFNRKHYGHRVGWAIHTGEWPKITIDHINGDRSDNRISNLREATHSQNMRNVGLLSANTSGFKGVSWHPNVKKWGAQIRTDSGLIRLGWYSEKEDAAEAYQKAAKIHHGDFSRC